MLDRRLRHALRLPGTRRMACGFVCEILLYQGGARGHRDGSLRAVAMQAVKRRRA